ncbi:MAG: cytochrome c oxidase subunit 3 family protein [Bacteroidetes bacterium]|nr:cytochrome c oxidase subunit 3 family protein [Bacteroidota bacterium]
MEHNATTLSTHEHYDPVGAKLGMWLFIFTEMLLFGALFIVYSVYRYRHPVEFHLANQELNVTIGFINTVILLISSATVAMSITAMQKGNKKLTMIFLLITLLLAVVFLINKYFEWGAKIHHGIYPGSEFLLSLSHGDILFFGLYFFMTGLHAIHIIVGMVILIWVFVRVKQGRVNINRYALLENGGLYWHLVDLIWIFLFPLFYLIH